VLGQSNLAFIKKFRVVEKHGIVIFSFRRKFFSLKKPKESQKAKQSSQVNQLEMIPKGQIKFFRPTSLKRGQISEI